MQTKIPQDVKRRHVLYIPGYDPFHPRRYRELFRKEGTEQARISSYGFNMEARQGHDSFGWYAATEIDGAVTHAEIEVLVWSDIVQSSMSQTIPATYLQLARTAWAYIGSGALFRLMRLRKGPVIAALYPIVFLLVQLVIAVTIATFAGVFSQIVIAPPLGIVTGTLVATLVFLGVLDLFKRADNKFFAYYLMHDYAFSAQWGGANPPELEGRMSAFGDTIAAALASDVDEVLVVGHSSGAHLAISILADLERQGRVPATGPKLAFLSLGHVVPMMSFLPKASRLRRDLHDLCQSSNVFWVDVTAPGDGCSFALCDPVAVSGVAPEVGKRGPLVFSAAFTKSLTPVRWRQLRRRFFRLHFQYLCAFDAPLDYDYFKITSGPLSLVSRYWQRAPSASRLETPVNKFTSMDPLR